MTVPIQRYRILELVDYGDDVLAVIEATGTGTRSGVTGTVSCGQLETWRDGKVTKIRYFTSKEAAREAAGLAK